MADKFANRAKVSVTESAANTLTFAELATGVSVFEKYAFNIHRINYEISVSSMNLLIASGDSLECGLTRDNNISTLSMGLPAVLDKVNHACTAAGTLGNFVHDDLIKVNDFGSLPGGGLLLPANPLYAAIKGSSLSAAADVTIWFWFTVVQLKADEYWELVEAYRITS